MNLLIDIGNTFTKLGFASQNEITEVHTLESNDFNRIQRLVHDADCEAAICSSSGKLPANFLEYFEKKVKYFLEFNHFTRVPLEIKYETPHTLGRDRLAAAVGGNTLYPGADLLIIDFGTAITYEFVSGTSYLGGNISPGMQTRFASLHEHTARLPLLNAEKTFQHPGKSTKDAILAGVIQGIVFEVERYTQNFLSLKPQGKVLITGGDSNFFAELIKTPIFVHSQLVLTGLNTILDYNK